MERLTQKDSQGNWSLKGTKCSELHEGMIITKELGERLYGALWKLMEYEDAEPDPGRVQELIERDTPMKALSGRTICPVCGAKVLRCYDFCRDCGQRLKWED